MTAPVRPHILALRAAEALLTLRTWLPASPATDMTPHLTAARDALGDVIAAWGNSPTGEQARSHRDALLRPGDLPTAATLKLMAESWSRLAGTLAARAGARLPPKAVCV